MADRAFADGDPRDDHRAHRVVDDTDAHAAVVRRLQARLDHQLRLLEQMQGDPLQSEPAQLPDLLDTARRMRRDSETLLLLAGHDPGVRSDAPQKIAALLTSAAAAAEEPRRIEVRPAADAAVVPGAATELVHVLAELLDHTTAVRPGARVLLASRVEGGGAVTVEVRAVGAGRHDPHALGGQRALDAAERIAARSRHGVTLRRELGPTGGEHLSDDLVATVTCPRAAVVAPLSPLAAPLAAVATAGTAAPPATGRNGHAGRNGSSRSTDKARPSPRPLRIEDLPAQPFATTTLTGAATELKPVNGSSARFTDGPSPRAVPDVDASGLRLGSDSSGSRLGSDSSGSRLGSDSSGSRLGDTPARPMARIDELFGPLTDIPFDPADAPTSTPIFEAIASAWFRDEAGTAPGAARDWESPGDREWRAAADRATRAEDTPLTAQGLPVRRPGGQLVPPPRSRTETSTPAAAERVPDRVRDRLAGYQRGLQQGRHRAEAGAVDSGDPDFW